MIKVLTVGVYDYFHLGHLRLFKNAKELGEYLIVAVQEDSYIKKFKPNASIFYSTEQRIEMVSAIKFVDEVTTYTSIADSIKEIDFDIFAIGEDQIHFGFQQAVEWCERNGKKVVRMHRTPNVSSTYIKEKTR